MLCIMKRLAILSTHPIQYNAPLFRMLQEDGSILLRVFFSKTWDQVKFDPDFQREVVWDIPLSEGYPHSTHDASTKAGKKNLKKAILDFSPDALLVYGWNFPGHLAMMRAFHGDVPIWFRGDSHLLDPLPAWKKALRWLVLSWVYRKVDLAFTVGEANARYFDWCGLPAARQIRAPHAVDNTFFADANGQHARDAKDWRDKLGILAEDKVVLFAGKLESKKQPALLLEAWNSLPLPKPHLLIAGSGPLDSTLRADWQGHPRLHFLGFQNQSQMPALYHMADVFCLPSAGPGETWGLAVNEALACGTPCLVSDRVGCGEDLLFEAHNGCVLPWNDVEAWGANIHAFIYQDQRARLPRKFQHSTLVHYLLNQLKTR